jgi:hypothetical protein
VAPSHPPEVIVPRRPLVLLPLLVLAAGAAPASAQSPAQPTVTAIGTGTAVVRPADRHDNTSIRRAVAKAVKRALPRAVGAARRDATTLASGYGLALGDVISVAETPPSPFSGPYSETDGPFGSGRFCGRISRRVTRRINGERRRVVRTRKVCSFPSRVSSSVTVTYSASPAQ